MPPPRREGEPDAIRVHIAGRLDRVPSARIERELRLRGGALAQRLSRRVDYLVVPHGAAARLDAALVDAILRRTGPPEGWVASEDGLLRWVGLLPPPAGPRDIPEERFLALARLDRRILRLIELFDVVTREGDRFGLEDLRAARAVGRLLGQGVPLRDILTAAARMRRRQGWTGPGEIAGLELAGGELMLRVAATLSEPEGQMRLALGDRRPDPDALFAAAEAAAAAGDGARAERIYRTCLDIAPGDPVVHFNLGNLLRDGGRMAEARLHFLAAARSPAVAAEAHYNLGHLATGCGQLERAVGHYRRATEAEPGFADAVYSLAQALIRLERHGEAVPALERYLALDPASGWAREARLALMACRGAMAARRNASADETAVEGREPLAVLEAGPGIAPPAGEPGRDGR